MNIISYSMKEQELKHLLEKYYNGDSTVSEEHLLREYFRKDNVPAGYEAEKVIFGYYSDSIDIPEPSADFETRMMAGVDSSMKIGRQRKMRRLLMPYLSAAAGIIIMLGSYFFFLQKSEPMDTFSDPELAYAETVKILKEVSASLNHGVKALEPVGKINEMKEKSFAAINMSKIMVEDKFRNFEYLQKAVEITNVPSNNDK